MNPLYIADFNYSLPDERIAKYPLPERDHSKLLIYRDGAVSEDHFYNVGEYIKPSALLIYNNTRVIQARLEFYKTTGARIEIFCLEPLTPHDYQLSLSSTTGCTWKCMVGNAKKWHTGDALELKIKNEKLKIALQAYKEEQFGNTFAVRFEWDGDNISFAEILDAAGELPYQKSMRLHAVIEYVRVELRERTDGMDAQAMQLRGRRVADIEELLHGERPHLMLDFRRPEGMHLIRLLEVGGHLRKQLVTRDADVHREAELLSDPLLQLPGQQYRSMLDLALPAGIDLRRQPNRIEGTDAVFERVCGACRPLPVGWSG